MSNISRVALFAKLNATAYKSVEGATVLCKLRGNPVVELGHWIVQILERENTDWQCIFEYFDVQAEQVLSDINRHLERLPTGSRQISDLSDDLVQMVERAWVYASLQFNQSQIRSGHVMLGLLKTDFLKRAMLKLSPAFAKISAEELAERFAVVCEPSSENKSEPLPEQVGLPGQASGAMNTQSNGDSSALDRYTQSLTAKARLGEIDPVTGRYNEIRQMVDILMRRRQNNPLITGEAGVGKTAVVEGLARQIVSGDVPAALRDVELLSLDIGLLQAGASMKGEFEQRLRQVVDEVQASEKPIILFIDEVHTLVGAGGAQGTGDAANLLKPALARGSLRTIGATTWSEYKKYIEKDPALTRRFQVVQVNEPDEAVGIDMLRGLVPNLAKHHGVLILDEAVKAAVQLSHRYIPARQLPDKAISLLDTACARVAVSMAATPAPIEQTNSLLAGLQAELDALVEEARSGRNHQERIQTLMDEMQLHESELQDLRTQWSEEKICIERFKSESALGADAEESLSQIQGENPLIFPRVDAQAVASVVADWTGIPVGRMVRNEIERVLELDQTLAARIVGQNHALELIAKKVQTSRAGLDDPNKPVAVFLFAGTSGVGKTETALALAEALFGGEQNLITLNMSEYQEGHTVSSLKGSPPGYVGYGEGGVLTEAVRRRPYSVVLLDEMEKAHSDVHELFFQVFDKGWMEDGEGRKIDFRNTLIIMTSNAGTAEMMSVCKGGEVRPEISEVDAAIRPALLKVFPPALLGRLDVVPFYPLDPVVMAGIVRLQLERVKKRVQTNHGLKVQIEDSVVRQIVSLCNLADSGGRLVGSLIANNLLPNISRRLLEGKLEGQAWHALTLSCEGGEFVYQFA